MLYVITSLSNPFLNYIKDDPVRPEIPLEFRVGKDNEVLVLTQDNDPQAVVCIAYRDFVPQDVQDLFKKSSKNNVAIFYTIWSYRPGAGRDLIIEARRTLPQTRPELTRFVTLSPQTEMARRFHLKNGATIFRENANSVNYEYA